MENVEGIVKEGSLAHKEDHWYHESILAAMITLGYQIADGILQVNFSVVIF